MPIGLLRCSACVLRRNRPKDSAENTYNCKYTCNELNPLNTGGSVCTTRFNALKLCILPTECVRVFRAVLTINSFLTLKNIINRLIVESET
jgi:hypothetical protein